MHRKARESALYFIMGLFRFCVLYSLYRWLKLNQHTRHIKCDRIVQLFDRRVRCLLIFFSKISVFNASRSYKFMHCTLWEPKPLYEAIKRNLDEKIKKQMLSLLPMGNLFCSISCSGYSDQVLLNENYHLFGMTITKYILSS